MSWTSPQAFLWLLAALVILAIYLIRGKKRPAPTATMFLWRRALAKRSPWLGIRPWISAALRSLIVLFLVLAMAAPMWGPLQTPERNFVFVLDATASMKATDVEPSRFAKAKSEILAMIDRLGPSDRAGLVVVRGEPFVSQRLTDSIDELTKALQAIQPSDAPGNCQRGVHLAEQLLRNAENAQALVYTDTSIEAQNNDTVRERLLATSATNMAITSIASRKPVSAEAAEAEVVVVVQRFGDNTDSTATLHWSADQQDQGQQQLQFEAGVAVTRKSLPLGSLVECRLEGDDHLASDNRAVLQLAFNDATVLLEGLASGANVRVDASSAGTLSSPQKETLETVKGQTLIGPLDEVGMWTWQSGAQTGQWSVNLCSPSESNIVASSETPLSLIEKGQQPPTPLHAWFLALALLTWAGEWLAFSLGVTE